MLKRALVFLAILAGLGLVGGLTLPWWWGAALRTVGDGYGVTFSRYETVGYGRWAVTDVKIEQPGFELEMARAEFPHPLSWGGLRSKASPVEVGQWHLELRETAAAETDASIAGLLDLEQRLREWWALLRPELPEVSVGPGSVRSGSEAWVSLKGARLTDAALRVSELGWKEWQANGVITGDGETVTLDLTATDEVWMAQAEWTGARLDLKGCWHEQPVVAEATWTTSGWGPNTAKVTAVDWSLDGKEVGLPDYRLEDGNVDVVWADGTGSLTLRVKGRPQPNTTVPEMDIALAGSVDGDRLQINELQWVGPGIQAVLTQPFSVNREGGTDSLRSEFSLQADLGALPFETRATGMIEGHAVLESRSEGWPNVILDIEGDALTWGDLAPVSGRLKGTVTWPAWEIKTASIQDEAGSHLEIKGSGADTEITDLAWKGEVAADSVMPWLPPDWTLGRIVGSGTLSGRVAQLKHGGSMRLTKVEIPAWHALDLEVDWTGLNSMVEARILLSAKAGELEADVDFSPENIEVRTADLRHDNTTVVKATDAFSVEWDEAFVLRNVNLTGPTMSVASEHLTASGGTLSARVDAPDWAWLGDWWASAPAMPVIRSAETELAWTESGITGTARFDGDVAVTENLTLEIRAAVVSDGAALEVNAGEVSWEGSKIAQMNGQLPLRLTPRAPYWHIEPEGSIDTHIALERNPAIWEALNQETQFKLENPAFDLTLGGTWNRPRGEGRLTVDRITFERDHVDGLEWPVVTAVEAKLIDDGTGLVFDPVTARLDDQEITLRGELPFTPEEWRELSEDPLAYFRDRGRGRIEVPHAQVSALAKFIPQYLVPKGEVQASLQYAPGEGMNGRIVLTDAVSRPLGPLGVLQDISAELVFANRTMKVEKVRALMGGQPVSVSGQTTWPETGAVEVDLQLTGENLPIVRKTGILLRSDLNLKIESDADGRGRVGGLARLRDGLVLIDVRSLVPKGGGGSVPSRRPPYFSVAIAPINQWELDITLQGNEFLRLQTPLLTGVASLDARLEGTLENPRVIGGMELSQAMVRLPFARFEVDESSVRLTDSNPYDPEILLEASGQRLGYDLRLELTGRASQPQLSFQSSPTLSSEEVLMLVMAGVTPQDESDVINSDRALKLGMYFGQGILGGLFGTDERERLTVSTGEKLSRLGKETYRFEYELADRWTAVAEYDEFDYYNAALKWRLRPGKPDPAPSTDDDENSEEAHDE